MMITDEIVKLARRFHKLGGNNGISIMEEGRWYVDIDDRKSPILMTYQTLKIAQSSNFAIDGILIRTESELWEWLQGHTRHFGMDGTLFYCQYWEKGGVMAEEWFDPNIFGLHHALYSACVWVLEQQQKLYNRRQLDANHNIG